MKIEKQMKNNESNCRLNAVVKHFRNQWGEFGECISDEDILKMTDGSLNRAAFELNYEVTILKNEIINAFKNTFIGK